MFFAAILAGGVGSRMKMADMPKQFLEIEGKPIIIYTLEKFLQSDKIQQIYIGVHPKWLEHMDSLVLKYAQDEKSRIHIVPGGEDRNSTLMNVIHQMEDDFGVSDDHYIITHDSVRPFVTVDMIDANVDAVKKYPQSTKAGSGTQENQCADSTCTKFPCTRFMLKMSVTSMSTN